MTTSRHRDYGDLIAYGTAVEAAKQAWANGPRGSEEERTLAAQIKAAEPSFERAAELFRSLVGGTLLRAYEIIGNTVVPDGATGVLPASPAERHAAEALRAGDVATRLLRDKAMGSLDHETLTFLAELTADRVTEVLGHERSAAPATTQEEHRRTWALRDGALGGLRPAMPRFSR